MIKKNGKRAVNEELANLLGADDPKVQIERVKQLAAPVVDLIIRYDNRFNQVMISTLGADLNYEQARAIVKLGEEKIRQLELQAIAAQTKQAVEQMQTQPPVSPEPGE